MFKGKLPLLIAVVAAILAAILAYTGLQSQEAKVSSERAVNRRVVALKDIPEGTPLSKENLTEAEIPVKFFKSAIKPAEMNQARIWGQKVAVPLSKGDPLLWSHIATTTAETRLSDTVQKADGRALTIKVSGEAALGSWLRPADHVDIIGIFRDPDSGGDMAVTLLQNVIILATGDISGQTNTRILAPNARKYDNITVHVMPEAAEMLILAQQVGSLYLTLRNREDTTSETRDEKTTIKTILTGRREKLIQEQIKQVKKQSTGIEIINGGK